MRIAFFILMTMGFMVAGNDARAACTSPAANAGAMEYFGAPDNIYKYCDGTSWAPMAGGADHLGNHTANQNLNMATRKIVNLGSPSALADGATKGYVDGKFGTLGSGKYCTSNGTQIICNANPPPLGGNIHPFSPLPLLISCISSAGTQTYLFQLFRVATTGQLEYGIPWGSSVVLQFASSSAAATSSNTVIAGDCIGKTISQLAGMGRTSNF